MEQTINANVKIAVVIPYYNASNQILKVVKKVPEYISGLIIVDDASAEALPTEEIKVTINNRTTCHFLKNGHNLGVGGATKKGMLFAIENGYEYLVKVDADDQMDLTYLPNLLNPLVKGQALVSKGNRFRDFKALQKMPRPRKLGNLILSFLVKIATGYWHNFDPTNGFVAFNTNALKAIDFSKLSNRYYFETSMLAELYFQKTTIQDVSMPAIYGDEKSNMNLYRMVFVFLGNLSKTFVKRIMKEYFLYDFNIASVYILFGVPLFFFGFFYGIYEWIYAAKSNVFTPTGTIMIITLSLILGFQLILQAIQYDIFNAPKSSTHRNHLQQIQTNIQ